MDEIYGVDEDFRNTNLKQKIKSHNKSYKMNRRKKYE